MCNEGGEGFVRLVKMDSNGLVCRVMPKYNIKKWIKQKILIIIAIFDGNWMRWWLFCVEFDTDVEAGTFFAGKFVVSMYARSGIQCEQSAHERA